MVTRSEMEAALVRGGWTREVAAQVRRFVEPLSDIEWLLLHGEIVKDTMEKVSDVDLIPWLANRLDEESMDLEPVQTEIISVDVDGDGIADIDLEIELARLADDGNPNHGD